MVTSSTTSTFDLKNAVSANRLVGLWRMMVGFRLTYIGAILSLGLATLARTATFLLLAYLVDDVLGKPGLGGQLPLVALGFVVLALFQGVFSFLSGRLAALTAEGVVLRLRNYMFDHIQRLSFTYHDRMQTGELVQRSTSDVDAVRRFFADQAIGVGRIVLLFVVNFAALLTMNTKLALLSVVVVPLIVLVSVFFFRRVSTAY
jgi:ATP-binding cassette subfamily B protein